MAEKSDRRRFLQRTALGAAGLGAAYTFEEKILLTALEDGSAGRAAAAEQSVESAIPCGKIGKVSISRLFIGGNLIGGWAHSRDLMYASKLFKSYNTEAKVFETLELAEQSGINTIQMDPAWQPVVEKYNAERGGKIQTMVCVHPDLDKAKMNDEIKYLVQSGATLLYSHGEVTDRLTMAGRGRRDRQGMELIKAQGVPAGVGGHSLNMPMACEKQNVDPDFYVKTFHMDRYWSATPEENRKEYVWYNRRTGDHDDTTTTCGATIPRRRPPSWRRSRSPGWRSR